METPATVGRGGRIAFTIITVVLGVFTGLGAISLVTGWFEGGERLIHRVHDIGTGIVGAILLAPAYLAQARSPERRIAALQQALLGLVTLVAVMFLAQDFAPEVAGFAVGFAVLLAVLVALHPARDRLWRPGPISLPSAVIVALAAVPLVGYGIHMGRLERLGAPTDPHVVEHHWTTMAAVAVGILLVGALAALRTEGWRIPAWCAGLAAVVFGTASVVFPGYAGSSGNGWGSVAIAGGVAFLTVTVLDARRAGPA
jgi:hypothetical protein